MVNARVAPPMSQKLLICQVLDMQACGRSDSNGTSFYAQDILTQTLFRQTFPCILPPYSPSFVMPQTRIAKPYTDGFPHCLMCRGIQAHAGRSRPKITKHNMAPRPVACTNHDSERKLTIFVASTEVIATAFDLIYNYGRTPFWRSLLAMI
jgi:hypothetical protein